VRFDVDVQLQPPLRFIPVLIIEGQARRTNDVGSTTPRHLGAVAVLGWKQAVGRRGLRGGVAGWGEVPVYGGSLAGRRLKI
jgi:hypothetical protein